MNREFCRLARSEGFSCGRCRCASGLEDGDDVTMRALDEDGEFVVVVDAGQGAREVLVRGRNLEAEVAALECEERGREVLFAAEEGGDCEDEDGPLLSGPVSPSARV